jgi:beta-lactamase regulating signal transducer with metallopeptidase domain
MIGHYVLRLLCLSLASFFLVNAAVGLTAALASPAAVRMAESMRARSAARFLLAVRLLPSALGIAVVLALCVPSYLWLEPQASSERIGWACLALAFWGAAGWFVSLARVTRALAFSVRFSRAWQKTECDTLLRGASLKAVIVRKDVPLLALAGVFCPRLLVSQAVLRSLSAEELDLALQHENAHRVSRDNLKRLFLLLSPAPIPLLHSFSSMERCWARFSEWAADDEAVRGDSHRALSLAAALLRVARMGAGQRLSFLHTSLCADDHDLSARVERLLRIPPLPRKPYGSARCFAIGSSLGLAVCAGVVLAWPATLSPVHQLLELFLR